MTLKVTTTALVDHNGGGDTYAISSLISLTATGNPAYLVVDALDRDEYTVDSSGATGTFSGNGASLGLGAEGGDARGAGIVFSWQAASGQYVNATYGALSQLSYTDSSNQNDITNISFWGTSNAALARAYAGNAYDMMQTDASGYLGSATVATETGTGGQAATQATPDSIVAAADSLVGQAWNNEGCWVLASTIAAEAGAGLPVQSTALNIAGAANGEWVPIYNGPVSASTNWTNLVSAGDMVVFSTSATSGHITTCVSGNGTSAMLVDNITYIGQGGRIADSANDGSANDVIIQPAHPAAQEFAGVSDRSVVIYALDTPKITDRVATETLDTGATTALSALFSATDPANKSITSYQVYDTGGSDSLVVGGHADQNLSPAAPLTASSLAAITLAAGNAATTDTLEVRGFNGTYWGDWQSLAVNVVVPPPKAPVLGTATPAQTWQQGSTVSLVLPATLFHDPQGAALTYSASGVSGTALPGWLSFNSATESFSGTVPAGMEKFSVVVKATDALGASATETFSVTVAAAAPVLETASGAVTVAEGSAGSFALPQGSFSDPQNENLTLKASLSSGAALPGWLKFTAATGVFSGTAPKTAETLQIKVTATDTSNLSASEVFSLAVTPAMGLGDWSAQAATKVAALGGFAQSAGPAVQSDLTPAIFSHPVLLSPHG